MGGSERRRGLWREKGVCVCALISTCMDPSWPHTSYHHTSLFLLQRALQSQRCVFEVCVCVCGRQGGTPSLHTDLTVIQSQNGTEQSQFSHRGLNQKLNQCLSLQVCVCAHTHSFREHPHEFRKLVCEQSQHGSERTQAGCEEDEEGQLLLGVD